MDAVQQQATVGVASAVILGGNLHRRGLTIWPPQAGRVTISFGAPAVLDQGVTIYTATSPRQLTEKELGHLLEQPVNAIADAGGRNIGITEYFQAGD